MPVTMPSVPHQVSDGGYDSSRLIIRSKETLAQTSLLASITDTIPSSDQECTQNKVCAMPDFKRSRDVLAKWIPKHHQHGYDSTSFVCGWGRTAKSVRIKGSANIQIQRSLLGQTEVTLPSRIATMSPWLQILKCSKPMVIVWEYLL
jgi:hypothetical protein